MIKKTALLLLLSSTAAMAADNEIRFNHLGANYIYADADGTDGDGYGMNLNVALTSWLFADFDYSTRSFDESGASADFEYVSGGFGGNYALNEAKSIQLFGTVTWEQLTIDVAGATTDPGGNPPPNDPEPFCTGSPLDLLLGPLQGGDCGAAAGAGNGAIPKSLNASAVNNRIDGYGLAVGIRAAVYENIEASAHYSLRDFSDDGDDKFYGVGVSYSLGDWVAVLNYNMYDDLEIDEWSLGVQYTFGKTDENASIW